MQTVAIKKLISLKEEEMVTIPQSLLTGFVDMYHGMKNFFELVDHTIAAREEKQGKVKSFKTKKDFFDDLDN